MNPGHNAYLLLAARQSDVFISNVSLGIKLVNEIVAGPVNVNNSQNGGFKPGTYGHLMRMFVTSKF